jgi:hypothetical protein
MKILDSLYENNPLGSELYQELKIHTHSKALHREELGWGDLSTFLEIFPKRDRLYFRKQVSLHLFKGYRHRIDFFTKIKKLRGPY